MGALEPARCRVSPMRVTRTIQAVLDMGLDAIGNELERIQKRAAGHPLIDRETEKLCNYVKATCLLAREEREARAPKNANPGGDLAAGIVEVLRGDPELLRTVREALKEGRAS